jgi:iron(III) transport system substrate-binding protein
MPILKRLFIVMIMAFMMPISSGLAAELNVYSYRVPQLLQPFLDAYTAETGTQFNVVHAPKGLAQRLQSEGAGSPADVVLTVDISRIAELENMGLLSPLNSDVINQRVPAHLRDDGGTWTALSTRARVIVVSNTRVQEGEITRIEDLAKPEWKGRICSRKGSHVYNRALLASLVVHLGEEAAEDWAKAYVDNLAKRPQGNDRAQAKSIYAGECDVALMNTYYYGAMANNTKNPEQQDWAKAIRMVFFNQDDRGQHINISAGGVVKTSPHQDEARAFLEWMTGPTAQRIYAEVNAEYPVNADVAPDPSVAAWGAFKADDVSIEAIGRASSTAQMIIDRTGW